MDVDHIAREAAHQLQEAAAKDDLPKEAAAFLGAFLFIMAEGVKALQRIASRHDQKG